MSSPSFRTENRPSAKMCIGKKFAFCRRVSEQVMFTDPKLYAKPQRILACGKTCEKCGKVQTCPVEPQDYPTFFPIIPGRKWIFPLSITYGTACYVTAAGLVFFEDFFTKKLTNGDFSPKHTGFVPSASIIFCEFYTNCILRMFVRGLGIIGLPDREHRRFPKCREK